MEDERITIRWKPETIGGVKNDASRRGEDLAAYIRKAAVDRYNKGSVSNVSGKNFFEYSAKKDNFAWKVVNDEGTEKIFVKDLSIEFLEQLEKSVKLGLSERESIIGKKKKKSVPLPKEVLE